MRFQFLKTLRHRSNRLIYYRPYSNYLQICKTANGEPLILIGLGFAAFAAFRFRMQTLFAMQTGIITCGYHHRPLGVEPHHQHTQRQEL